jgi:hypothetical protein
MADRSANLPKSGFLSPRLVAGVYEGGSLMNQGPGTEPGPSDQNSPTAQAPHEPAPPAPAPPAPAQQQAPQAQSYQGQPSQQVVYVERAGNGLAVASLVLGIVGVVFGLIPLTFFIALICGVLALIFGIVGWRAANKGRGRKGLAVSGTVLGVVALLLAFAGVFIIGEAADDLENELDEINRQFEEDLENLED